MNDPLKHGRTLAIKYEQTKKYYKNNTNRSTSLLLVWMSYITAGAESGAVVPPWGAGRARGVGRARGARRARGMGRPRGVGRGGPAPPPRVRCVGGMPRYLQPETREVTQLTQP